jgi:hypothetical protein
MSLHDRLKVKRQQKRANDRLERNLLKEQEEQERAKKVVVDVELSLVDQIKELAIENDIKLSLKPLMIDEESNEYDQRSTIYKVPVTKESVDRFRLLCNLTFQNNKYVGGLKFQKSVDPDVQIHVFPVLECSLVRADPSNPKFTIRTRSDNHPLYVIPRITAEGSSSSLMDCTSEKSPRPSGQESDLTSTKQAPTAPSPPPPPPLSSSLQKTSSDQEKEWLLYLRCTSGSRQDLSSWGSLESSLQEGRWVSEKLIVKWSLQLVRTLWQLHNQYHTFGSMYSRDISLVSDQTIVSMNNAKITYITKTEERGMAMNLYNKDYKGVYIRSDAMLTRLNLEREDIIRKKKQLEKQKSGLFEDEGDGAGGLIDSVPTNNLFSYDPDQAESPPDRESMRKLFTATDQTERESILASIGGSSVNEKRKKKFKETVIVPEASNRKDAWLQLPFEEIYKPSYVESATSKLEVNDDATSINSSMFSYTTASSFTSTMSCDAPPIVPKKKKGSKEIGENTQLQMEFIPRPQAVVSKNVKRVAEKSTNAPDLEKYATPEIDEYEKKKKFMHHVDLAKRVPSLLGVKKLSKKIVPQKRFVMFFFLSFFLFIFNNSILLCACTYTTVITNKFPVCFILISKADESFFNFKGEVKQTYLDDLLLCKANFESFLREIHTDYRYLGIIIMEAYTRSTIDYQEKEVMLRPTYTYEDLIHFFDISRTSKGIKKLLQFCFTKVPLHQHELITSTENLEFYSFESTSTLQSVEEILSLLEKELRAMGGVGAPDLSPEKSFLSDEDREQYQLDKETRRLEMANKAIEGRYLAADRVAEHNKQVQSYISACVKCKESLIS